MQTWRALDRQTLKVWSTRAVVDLRCFRSTKFSVQDFLTLRIISGGKCAVSEREICLKVKKNKIWAERADQTHVNNLPFCFNG